jgi:hypothetical protein
MLYRLSCAPGWVGAIGVEPMTVGMLGFIQFVT